MSRILITAGAVYGKLDDNKLVGNRSRGIWAAHLASLLRDRGHEVIFLIPDIPGIVPPERVQVIRHNGFWDYQAKCRELAPTLDAAVMAAAVVNWIPETPFHGKMLTVGVGERMLIPFILAPHVIDEMRRINPKMHLIGCKMTSGSSLDQTLQAAYGVCLRAKCHCVVANDLAALKKKSLVFPDGTIMPFEVGDPAFLEEIVQVIEDQHFSSTTDCGTATVQESSVVLFDRLANHYRNFFTGTVLGIPEQVFGSIAVRAGYACSLISPRKKGPGFSSANAVYTALLGKSILLAGLEKASLNAPLLVRMLFTHRWAEAVLHLHVQLPNVPTLPYAPPGTVRDSHRDPLPPIFNIQGHGFVAALSADESTWPKL